MADALSRLPNAVDDIPAPTPVAVMLTIETDLSLLETIWAGYRTDPFCMKILQADKSFNGIHWEGGLLYIGDCLIISCMGTLHKDLFHLTCDSLGHFSFEKLYVALHAEYYWPNM